MASKPSPKYLLVIGEAGDGKSTLIKNLKKKGSAGEDPVCGRKASGVTKEIHFYEAEDLKDGTPVWLIDTPGVGDHDINVVKLISLLETMLKAEGFEAETGGGLDGVVVTSPIPDSRISLGGQVVKTLVAKGFVGEEKWDSIILTGTFFDKATKEKHEVDDGDKTDIEMFLDEKLPVFFEDNNGKGKHAFTSKGDASMVLEAILSLPRMKVVYEPPAPEVMASSLGDMLGTEDLSELAAEITELRATAQKEAAAYKQQIEELKMQLQDGSNWSAADITALGGVAASVTSAIAGLAVQNTRAHGAHRMQDLQMQQEGRRMEAERQRQMQQMEMQQTREMQAQRMQAQQGQMQMMMAHNSGNSGSTAMMMMAASQPQCALM